MRKALRPVHDPGRFDLWVDGHVVRRSAGDGAASEPVEVAPGLHSVGETAAAAAPALAHYVASIACTKRAGAHSVPVASSEGSVPVASGEGHELRLEVRNGDAITCTVTNVRKARIIIKKRTLPAAEGEGAVRFGFSTSLAGGEAFQLGHGQSEVREVAPGDYRVTEHDSGPHGYKLGDLACSESVRDDRPAVIEGRTVHVWAQAGDEVHCTYTNVKLHPAIALRKEGPATATAGDLLTYTLLVTNPGDVSFPEAKVSVTDALCQAPPVLQGKSGDSSPAKLDPGDSWSYTCQVQSQVGQTAVRNVAEVKAGSEYGHWVSAQDTFTTELRQPPLPQPPPQPAPEPAAGAGAADAPVSEVPAATEQLQVLKSAASGGAPRRAGSAKLRGPAGCPRGAVARATVTGSRIIGVTFSVDGRKAATLKRPDAAGRWTLVMRMRSLRYGAHRVVAQVRFAADSGTPAKTLRLVVTRCGSAVRPTFAG